VLGDQSYVLEGLCPLDHEGRRIDNLDKTHRLIQSIVRRFNLTRQDAEDVTQTVWLRLLEKLDRVRDPRALPGWIFTTTRNEVVNAIRRSRKADLVGDDYSELHADEEIALPSDDSEVRKQALLEALSELSDLQQRLVGMLIEDPQPSYSEISRRLNIPVGSIGPNRARALNRLRRSRSLAQLGTDETLGYGRRARRRCLPGLAPSSSPRYTSS
jgi:RNA polymerase sigma factor (sigma-70 family)